MLRKPLIVLGILSGILLAILGTLALIGTSLSEDHHSVAEETLPYSIEKTWSYVSNIEDQARWNHSITKVELVEGSKNMWKETYHSGDSMTYETLEVLAPNKLVRRIADENAPFQGKWTIMLSYVNDDKTKVTVVEDGSIKNPFLRFMVHKVIGLEKFQRNYLNSLQEGMAGDLASK